MAPVRKASCLQCGRIRVPAGRGLCALCLKEYRAKHDKARVGKRERSHYSGDWKRVSRQEIAKHIARHGYRCPTCTTADPETNPLTTDHVQARSREAGLRVICRRCNARKSG